MARDPVALVGSDGCSPSSSPVNDCSCLQTPEQNILSPSDCTVCYIGNIWWHYIRSDTLLLIGGVKELKTMKH